MKYEVGDIVSWVIDNRKMVVTDIASFADGSYEYICAFANKEGMPSELRFIEQELDIYEDKKLGFGVNSGHNNCSKD